MGNATPGALRLGNRPRLEQKPWGGQWGWSSCTWAFQQEVRLKGSLLLLRKACVDLIYCVRGTGAAACLRTKLLRYCLQDELACLKGELPAKIVKEVKGRTRTLEVGWPGRRQQLACGPLAVWWMPAVCLLHLDGGLLCQRRRLLRAAAAGNTVRAAAATQCRVPATCLPAGPAAAEGAAAGEAGANHQGAEQTDCRAHGALAKSTTPAWVLLESTPRCAGACSVRSRWRQAARQRPGGCGRRVGTHPHHLLPACPSTTPAV